LGATFAAGVRAMRWIAASVTWRDYHAAVERRVMILW
jgi:hypothetical protein